MPTLTIPMMNLLHTVEGTRRRIEYCVGYVITPLFLTGRGFLFSFRAIRALPPVSDFYKEGRVCKKRKVCVLLFGRICAHR